MFCLYIAEASRKFLRQVVDIPKGKTNGVTQFKKVGDVIDP